LSRDSQDHVAAHSGEDRGHEDPDLREREHGTAAEGQVANEQVNRYSYALNSRYRYTDPSCRFIEAVNANPGAWHRLRTVRGTASDRQLLRHETAEMWNRTNVNDVYEAAHPAANRHWNWQMLVELPG
jgi:hypothetical protein